MSCGHLYIVATPIGNLADISYRAVELLKSVDLIAAEDTRHSRYLLTHYQISTPCMSLHDHNETQRSEQLVYRLLSGENIALISDAGTPLISDPGFRLVSRARDEGVVVSPIPGACAAIAALSVAGLPTDQFFFDGFLPAKSAGRRQRLTELSDKPCTLVFYESTHRILAMLRDMQDVLGERRITLARELTKKFETVLSGSVEEVLAILMSDSNQQKGEFVVMVTGLAKSTEDAEGLNISGEHRRLLSLLAPELPPKKAAAIVSEISGISKRIIYNMILENK
ncbi:MAG: 16S rRNA (cytidine(1402)-2'-O)-methyltransferase [Pseudomonadales bacterium]|nr:16S rRNA (cytidine(1402)-2'-O)-methyltransferase [Pseudomonadales bacterium]